MIRLKDWLCAAMAIPQSMGFHRRRTALLSLPSSHLIMMKKESDHSSPIRRKSLPSSSHHVPSAISSARGRIYRVEGSKMVTRDIAALDFLLGIPMEAEPNIVKSGWAQQQADEDLLPAQVSSATGKWFEKYIVTSKEQAGESKEQNSQHEEELEKPNAAPAKNVVIPGRRLDGDDATRVQIPLSGVLESKTRQRSIARQAAIREWEMRVAHGLDIGHEPLLDNRVFFSASEGYPMEVFSLVRYEPKKEEAARRRQKLEELGGGGSQFVIPERDWRGTSYRALLPRVEKKNKSFNLLLGQHKHPQEHKEDDESDRSDRVDDDDDESTSSDESDAYVPGFLDDPEMKQGRHRHVMIGDRVTGCCVSSTIQFVKPEELKADLNKQFRERFDGWEPPKSQWKYIGAKVIDGVYTLQDPTENEDHSKEERRPRQGSISSHTASSTVDAMDTIRMPPSLTLSKIRGVKQQALVAAVNANMEVSTVALACVYFERLCLGTQVDKSNRRLAFAACLLLAAKINEKNVRLDIRTLEDEDEGKFAAGLHSLVKPTKASSSMFASLLEFFAHDWSLSLKTVFAAEWGVFVALGFSLHTTPSQVAFHFKRMMKTLGWSPLSYLGPEMYSQWQESLEDEAQRRAEHEERKELRRERKERKLLQLQRERLQQENDDKQRETEADSIDGIILQSDGNVTDSMIADDASSPSRVAGRKSGAMKLFHRLALKRNPSMEKLADHAVSEHHPKAKPTTAMARSPSVPILSRERQNSEPHIAIDIEEEDGDGISVGAVSDGGLMF